MNHIDRIQKAIDFIENHLKEDLSIENLAREARYSLWHFQRVFGSIVGDSVKEYIRKRRLTSALTQILEEDTRLLDIALEYQFESQESFTRAFKSHFGLPPGEVRRAGISNLTLKKKPRLSKEYLDHLYKGLNMQPKLISLPEKYFVGFGAPFISILSDEKTNHIVIPQLWQKFLGERKKIKNTVGLTDFGVCECLPESVKKSHPEECSYLAGAEVTSVDEIPEGMISKTVPAGRYAVFTHKGNLKNLAHTMNYIYGAWIPKSQIELREAPDLEVYDHRFCGDSEDSELDIYIPIK